MLADRECGRLWQEPARTAIRRSLLPSGMCRPGAYDRLNCRTPAQGMTQFWILTGVSWIRLGRRHNPAWHGYETGMDGQNENLQEPQSGPVATGLAPPDELETDEVPDSLVSEFSSLTTPYCWVITEDAVAGYDGAEPSAVGKSGPGHAVAGDVTEALNAGRFFRLVDGKGRELAIGRLYDPSGRNELAPLDDFGRQNLDALNIEFRAEGDWQAA